MRASTAVSLLFASSMSIFGVFATTRRGSPPMMGIEPVWVNGQMGVYSPSTGEFVPSTSPLYAQTVDELRDARDRGMAPDTWPYSPGSSGYYYHRGAHSFGSASGWSGGISSSGGGISAARSSIGGGESFGSARGGIGETGHSFGGAHG